MSESQQGMTTRWARVRLPVLIAAAMLVLAMVATSASAAPVVNAATAISIHEGVASVLIGPVPPRGIVLVPGGPVPRSPFVPPAVPGRPPWGPGGRPSVPPITPPWARF